MNTIEKLLRTDRPWLTDGGLETWLFFQQGFSAPEFAAIVLLDEDDARAALRRYFDGFLEMAREAGTGYVLDTATWRGTPIWASKLGLSEEGLLRLSRDAVAFAREIRSNWSDRVADVVINGVVGPAGDGYEAGTIADAATAQHIHTPQIAALAESGADMISAITMTGIPEAVGIARAAKAAGLPSVISFTLETDGRLPSGDTLGAAIEAVDQATDGAPAYYMINCAHPDHFRGTLADGSDWLSRIGGVRANASRLSHAELDEAERLDEGNPEEFGSLHQELAELLPSLRVVGGCCGTDHRHVGCVSHNLHKQAA
ncbi:MAG: homocysteine S-methyltransferase [Sphingopyxis sp.]|nr:MAG: homocysteine S-methyltransferase [Sphingopyxis sp.]